MWPGLCLYPDYLPGFARQKAQTILKVRARVGEESQNLLVWSKFNIISRNPKRNCSLHVLDVFLLSMIMLKIDTLTLELLSNMNLKWNVRACITRVSPWQPNSPASQQQEWKANKRQKQLSLFPQHPPRFFSLFRTRHFRPAADATNVV